MKRKLTVCFLLICVLLLGCRAKTPDRSDNAEPVSDHGWISGESPFPEQRVGIDRGMLSNHAVAVSPSGIYAVSSPFPVYDSYIVYADNDSDTFVKLCGRVDCTHSTSDCNAYVYRCGKISYYGGYLYAVSGTGALAEKNEILRMDPDGTNRITVYDLSKFMERRGDGYLDSKLISRGYYIFKYTRVVDMGDGKLEAVFDGYYYYKLDGTTKEPVKLDTVGAPLYDCGDVLLTVDADYRYYAWDIEAGTETYLTGPIGVPAWFGEEACYYFKDGAIRRLVYATQAEEILADTGLGSDYCLICFPDCLVVASRGLLGAADSQLYIYNWEFEKIDTVQCGFLGSNGLEQLLIAETASRLIFSDDLNSGPKYYIEKSELGTGNAVVHEYTFF